MKKSEKKVINYLKRYVGHTIIRIKPTLIHGDWSYTSSPVLLLGFTSDGRIKCRFSNKSEGILSREFTDRNWISYKKAVKPKGNKLNKYKCKEIRRICPTERFNDKSYMDDSVYPVLVAASKHHMVIDIPIIGKHLLREDYVKPEDWELVK